MLVTPRNECADLDSFFELCLELLDCSDTCIDVCTVLSIQINVWCFLGGIPFDLHFSINLATRSLLSLMVVQVQVTNCQQPLGGTRNDRRYGTTWSLTTIADILRGYKLVQASSNSFVLSTTWRRLNARGICWDQHGRECVASVNWVSWGCGVLQGTRLKPTNTFNSGKSPSTLRSHTRMSAL